MGTKAMSFNEIKECMDEYSAVVWMDRDSFGKKYKPKPLSWFEKLQKDHPWIEKIWTKLPFTKKKKVEIKRDNVYVVKDPENERTLLAVKDSDYKDIKSEGHRKTF